MIYVFGDLRQLRRFELVRVESNASGSSQMPLLSEKPHGNENEKAERQKQGGDKERRGGWRMTFGLKSREEVRRMQLEERRELQERALPFRKESLLPVVNPVLVLPPPARVVTRERGGSVSFVFNVVWCA